MHVVTSDRPGAESGTLRPVVAALFPAGLGLLLGAMSWLDRVRSDAHLAASFRVAAGVIVLGALTLALRGIGARHRLRIRRSIYPSHYVQAALQLCIYGYWGWYWHEVQGHAALIVAQLLFAYSLDMLLSWFRRGTWFMGFGQFPIIFSTNLFIWFRDDWFAFQFVMVALGLLGKEFLRWNRGGRNTHIFNPSAFSLFVVSIALLATQSTQITWGPEIARAQLLPDHIFLEVFLLGIVVQFLFYVTLTTLAAAAVLFLFSLSYTAATGIYYFGDSTVSIAIFIGLHLLVTDPATSPRSNLGKVFFGGLYGAGVVVAYALLEQLGAPTFYDKLLCVPLLNLSVQALDRLAGSRLFSVLSPERWSWKPTIRQLNLVHMGIWTAMFLGLLATGHAGPDHEGRHPEFWEGKCAAGNETACARLVKLQGSYCKDGDGAACDELGRILSNDEIAAVDTVRAGESFRRACDLGYAPGCGNLERFRGWRRQAAASFARGCEAGDPQSCASLAVMYHRGDGVLADQPRAVSLLGRACDLGHEPSCLELRQIERP